MSTYGYSVYDSGYFWQGKINPSTVHNYYGLTLYSQLDVNPFVAVPRDYRTIMLTWRQPQGTIYGFRLVANRYGFPVDQNDGDILIDSSSFPGTGYADQNVVPGTYHYYGIYLQITNTPPALWERAAFAVCLAPSANGMGDRMFNLLPPYYRENLNGELTQSAAGDLYLQQYFDVLGWGADYLKTQYDILLRHLNDPMFIPLGDLVNLATQLGMPFQPEVPAYVMRKALANWTHVCQLRGTPSGLSENITVLTGYPVDLQSGRNRMLENDQAGPLHPTPAAWNAGISYVLNELVSYGNYIYKLTSASGNQGNAPSGTSSANTWWTAQLNVTDPASTLANPNTVGGINTWQALYPSLDAGGSYSTPSGSLVGTIGLVDPLNGSNFQHNAFSVFNKSGGSQDMLLRSVSQIASDRTGSNTNMTPDPLQAVQDGVPMQRIDIATNGWDSTKRYATGEVVLYEGMLFQALRASTNAPPPTTAPLNANPYFETNASSWTSLNSAALAQSATQAFQGSDSLRITPDGSHASPGALSEQVAVIPNAAYSVSGWVFCATASQSAQVGMNWYDSYGQFISSSSMTAVSVGTSTWTQVSTPVTAPASAATGQIYVQLTGTPANTVLNYWDAVVLACYQTPEWALLSRDNRLRMMMSAYADGPSATVQVVPSISWYDETGKPIVSNGLYRVTARTSVAGTPGGAPNLTYDSFNLGGGTFLNGRLTDSKDQNWAVKTGAWQVSQFADGSVYPAVAATRSVATVTSLATGITLGVTFTSTVPSGTDSGIVFRMVDLTSYWRAGMTGLYKVTGSSAALVGNYSTACAPGDRLSVNLNGSNITVYRNGVQVLTTTDSYNSTATIHGLAVEATTI